MSVFIEVVLPIISIFIIGYALQKWKKLDVRSVSAVTIYVFIPALVFQTFLDAELNEDFRTIIIFCFLLLFFLILLNKLIALIFKWDQSSEGGMILATAFMNAGNYGAPVVLFAFGEEAFVLAVIFMSIQTMIMNFFGVYYASRGKSGVRFAIISVLKMPATYAMIIALSMQFLNVGVHPTVMEMVDFLAAVAIPLMMIVLGMQLANISFKEFEIGHVAYGTVVRLIVSPLAAWLLVTWMDVDQLLGNVIILLSAMPAAATTTMFALEFRARPDLVSSITLVTTVLSVVTVSVLLMIL
ncbi:AEC family transporter [Halalkalibacillus sediminis]|uniref:AEC family transporter n=1 Tax=Halalkalibacillus sediminis TaxID=2018042 RepID=A0A2I0QV17_9BACI|nr:AEC family transporter [Halalkalibacillus sediminis]PKR77940.1 AEC family transporter [Halalkalibacillus sediminis]